MKTWDVRGKGPFPYDMLRYDRCFPASQTDVIVMEAADYRDERTVRVMCDSPHNKPTTARWSSFGWEVV